MKYLKKILSLATALFFIVNVKAQTHDFDTVSYQYNGRTFKLKQGFINNFKEELEVINIQNGDTIADIGAGECFLEGSLYFQFQDLTVIANDINSTKLNNLNPLLEFLKKYINHSGQYISVLGNDTTTNISGLTFDKIIIRDALHHFIYPDKILSEVKKLIKVNGKIFIIEILSGETKRPPSCNQIINREEFFKIMNRNNFKLVKETSLPSKNFIVFEFQSK